MKKIGFLSLNMRLLLLIGALMVGTLGYLMKSYIAIQLEDKLKQAYQNQSYEVKIVNQKLSSSINSSLNTIRQMASGIIHFDKPEEKVKVDVAIKNQKEIKRLYVLEVPLVVQGVESPDFNWVYTPENQDLEKESIKHWIVDKFEEMQNKNLAFANLTGDQGVSQVGLFFPDLSYDPQGLKMLLYVAVLDLDHIKQEHSSLVEVADEMGWLLYSSDITRVFSRNIASNPLFSQALEQTVKASTLEYESEDKKQLGSYFKTEHNLIVMSSQPLVKIQSTLYQVMQQMVLVGLMALAMAIILVIIVSRSITNPIEELCEATGEISKGNFNIKLNVQRSDEVGVLAGSFNEMTTKIQQLIKKQLENQKMEAEVAIATTVHKTLFPPDVIDNECFKLSSFHQAATNCGGDIWTHFNYKNKLYVMIADATGHGLASAFITVSAKATISIIKRLVEQTVQEGREISVADILSFANRAVYDTSQKNIFMTMFVLELDLETGDLKFANAGHNPPWIFRPTKVESLSQTSVRLGEAEEETSYKVKSSSLKPGDKIFLYTDGITEGTNKKGEDFGKKEVRQIMERELPKGGEQALKTLTKEFNVFSQGKPNDDDITLVVLEFKKNKTKEEAA